VAFTTNLQDNNPSVTVGRYTKLARIMMKIAIVEDDRSIQMVLELVFSRVAKCQVLVASNGIEGLALIKKEKPDVVLLDLMMPGMDGFEVCQHVKADASVRQTPIIFLTAQPQPTAVARAMELGAAGYLIKPFDPIKIIDQVNEALTRVQAPLISK
jgi:two-component system, OmpR family, alkaline phosphatase synthesis response regulator PhoP